MPRMASQFVPLAFSSTACSAAATFPATPEEAGRNVFLQIWPFCRQHAAERTDIQAAARVHFGEEAENEGDRRLEQAGC